MRNLSHQFIPRSLDAAWSLTLNKPHSVINVSVLIHQLMNKMSLVEIPCLLLFESVNNGLRALLCAHCEFSCSVFELSIDRLRSAQFLYHACSVCCLCAQLVRTMIICCIALSAHGLAIYLIKHMIHNSLNKII